MAPSLSKLLVYPSGVLVLGTTVVLYGMQYSKLPREDIRLGKILSFSTSTPVTQTNNQVQGEEEYSKECDCLPLWQCMTSGQDDCSRLEQELRLCMQRNKVGKYIEYGEIFTFSTRSVLLKYREER